MERAADHAVRTLEQSLASIERRLKGEGFSEADVPEGALYAVLRGGRGTSRSHPPSTRVDRSRVVVQRERIRTLVGALLLAAAFLLLLVSRLAGGPGL